MTSAKLPDNSKSDDRVELTHAIKHEARNLGFDLVGVAPAVSPSGYAHLTDWLRQGFAGEMQYLDRRESAYEHPRHVMEGVRSVIMLAINYHTRESGFSAEAQSVSTSALVAKYARGSADYHDTLRAKLRQLSDRMHVLRPDCRTRGVVDTAPLLERDFANLAGLGWFGKNTMLINKRIGSWLLLAGLLTDLELEPDEPHATSHCGTCTRCLDVCPTDAFTAPYILDARRCISYLTIELRQPIPMDLRTGIGDWVFGCDLCQDVCPWNRKAPDSKEPTFQPLPDMHPANALDVLRMSRSEFEARFAKTPLGRPGWEGLRRNAAMVLGNSGDVRLIPILKGFLDDPSSLVNESVEWAIANLDRGVTPSTNC